MAKSSSTRTSSMNSTSDNMSEWAKENRAGFFNWIYTRFYNDINKSPKKSKGKDANNGNDQRKRSGSGSGSCDCSSGSGTEDGSCTAPTDISMLPHQRFIRDYIQYDSPYRGILLYHGLGTGKSFSSIAAAEGFLNRHKKIVVMIPASLGTNYRQEIMRFGSIGRAEIKKWSIVNFKKNEKFANGIGLNSKLLKKYNNLIWTPNLPANFPDKLIIDGKRDLKWNRLTAEEKVSAIDTINSVIDDRYTFVNYNGLTKKNITQYNQEFFNDAFVIIDEAHNFINQIVNGGRFARKIYQYLMNASNIRLVLLSGTPIINHPFELSYTLNLIRGPMKVHEFGLLATSRIPTATELKTAFDEEIGEYIDQIIVIEGQRKIHITLLPNGFVNTDEGALKVQRKEWDMNEDAIITKMITIMNAMWKIKIGKKIHTIEKFALPERKQDFENYFLDLTDPENPRVKNMDLFMRRNIGTISYFRTAGEEFFPKLMPKNIIQIPLCDYQFSKYIEVRNEELQMEIRKKRRNARKNIPIGGVLDNKGSVYRAFSRMACNFVFPEDIKRPFPKDLRAAARREIDAGEDEISESEEETDEGVATANKKKERKVDETEIQAKYDEAIKKAMITIKARSEGVLTHDKLNALYSSKMARMLEDIENSPGKVLMYSQFRSIEGLGIFKIILETAGYVDIRIEGGVIQNADEVLKSEYNGKRFMLFDPDREKARILLHLYNGEYDKVSPEIQEQLRSAGIISNNDNGNSNVKGSGNNLRGETFKAIMITQSGAEGISLKNTRRVMITEPFWNMVRMDQVIGRAVRTCSHMELPVEERNVEVFIYTSVFTEKQLKDNFTLRRLDLGLTSDSHILQIAEKKDVIIQTFLNHLKSCAVDCRIHAGQNKPRELGFSCYSFPIPTEPETNAFLPDIVYDKPTVVERRKRIQGRVVIVNGTKYVVVEEYPDILFNYDAYKNAGVLEKI